jgi:hypothetical protein
MENNLKYYFGWVVQGFDDRAKKITKAFNLNHANVPLQYSVPKSCTGDPAKEQEMSSCSKCKR